MRYSPSSDALFRKINREASVAMLYGGHVKALDDIGYLQDLKFDLGEVVLRNAESRAYWLDSGITNGFDSGFFLIAHGPREGPPNDIRHLWENYYPAAPGNRGRSAPAGN